MQDLDRPLSQTDNNRESLKLHSRIDSMRNWNTPQQQLQMEVPPIPAKNLPNLLLTLSE
jgi:hypothetical protein